MAYCTYCGQSLRDGANFCRACGTPVRKAVEPARKMVDPNEPVRNTVQPNEPVRKIIYSGEIHKCPSCGMVLESFLAVCPSCGYELRGTVSPSSIKEFSARINSAPTPAHRLYIIQNYPVPNTKEDILEFMILAASNFDARHFVYYSNYESTSSAWLSKIEQCFQKASLVLVGADLEQIHRIYRGVMDEISRERQAQDKLLEKKEKEFRKNESANRTVAALPNMILCAAWVISLLVLIPLCSNGAHGETYAVIMFFDILGGAIFIPIVARSNSSIPRLIVSIGIVAITIILIPLCSNGAYGETYAVLLFFEIIAAIVIIVRMFRKPKKSK